MLSTYVITGMTCGNCVKHVTEEVKSIDGVRGVDVQLDGGRMAINSDGPIDIELVKAAVAEAGEYQVRAD
ncbi:heavy-metal-associated domain-containing protein [Aestuariimicrobium ganziense]|uniref:heavy-metal-associated domain-containing protein n=1 Tax=Aestuariimicrobium ganziense TaxID=2773677 RepID=UPI001943410B|nr:heavy-metal-associated domain-containing protein [Aestuariimicrobium ganziense]